MLSLGRHEWIVGLGSNAQDALTQLRLARQRIRSENGFRILASSGIYHSEALLPTHAPAQWNQPYLNAACVIEVRAMDLTVDSDSCARKLLALLKRMEQELGRTPAPRWAPRSIDLDLLAWGGPDLQEATITIPHAGLLDRPFAWLPAIDCLASLGRQYPFTEWQWTHPESIPFRTHLTQKAWPEIVGILNLTPDSFSESHSCFSFPNPPQEMESRVRALVQGGASIIDVGAESTRPGSHPVSGALEIQRLEPFCDRLIDLRNELSFQLSLDTRHPETLAWMLNRLSTVRRGGLDWINDVSGFSDPRLFELAVDSPCRLVVMHSLGVPPQRDRVLSPAEDPIAALLKWGDLEIERWTAAGVDSNRLILDPGVGFGKTGSQNMAILLRSKEWNHWKVSVLIGHSRKRFLDVATNLPPEARELETGIFTAGLAKSGVDYIRVHSPQIQSRALSMGMRGIS